MFLTDVLAVPWLQLGVHQRHEQASQLAHLSNQCMKPAEEHNEVARPLAHSQSDQVLSEASLGLSCCRGALRAQSLHETTH